MTAEEALHEAAQSFREYYQGLPARVDARELLGKRALVLYWALGTSDPHEFAKVVVADRLAASREMALGYLYERVMELVVGARKLSNLEKKTWRGIDFRREVGRDVYLINLKSARATSNGDISDATMRNLVSAVRRERADREGRERSGEDNPLASRPGKVRAVRAIARGRASKTERVRDGETVEVAVGDELWRMLGAGDGFGRKVQDAVGDAQVDRAQFLRETAEAEGRVLGVLKSEGCLDSSGLLQWSRVLDVFPDV
jgi:hypothetical protein